MKVFLGGTCAESKWRDIIIPKLECDYFNPVVKDWTPECQRIEEEQKEICKYHLYVITPKMKGVFSIAEAVNDSIQLPKGHCVFCITKEDDDRDFTKGEEKSLSATSFLIRKNGGFVFDNLNDVIEYLNNMELLDKFENLVIGEYVDYKDIEKINKIHKILNNED